MSGGVIDVAQVIRAQQGILEGLHWAETSDPEFWRLAYYRLEALAKPYDSKDARTRQPRFASVIQHSQGAYVKYEDHQAEVTKLWAEIKHLRESHDATVKLLYPTPPKPTRKSGPPTPMSPISKTS